LKADVTHADLSELIRLYLKIMTLLEFIGREVQAQMPQISDSNSKENQIIETQEAGCADST
jgi:serine/threonine-protein kinase RIO1